MRNFALDVVNQSGAVVVLGGVSGSGMIGLARMALQKGLRIYGCDRQKSEEVVSLESAGLKYFDEGEVVPTDDVDLVVCSSALSQEHPLRKWAWSRGVPVAGRAEMLAALLEDREVIAVVGTHGKTTTAVLMSHALRKLGRDISFYIGAEVPLFGTSAYLGQDSLAVVEADESDGSFTYFNPRHILVLNIEEDHLDHYSGISEIKEAFSRIVSRCDGEKIICGDDPVARDTFKGDSSVIMFGFGAHNHIRGAEWRADLSGSSYQVQFENESPMVVNVALSGKHNASNVLGVLSACVRLGYQPAELRELFEDVRGARRRLETLVDNDFGIVIDDYAHHPTEISATITAAKKTGQRLVAVFQPHRFSRTEKLLERFEGCFKGADTVYLTDIYAAGEAGTCEDTGLRLKETVARSHDDTEFFKSLNDLKHAVRANWRKGDKLLVMGAGDISRVAHELSEEIRTAGEIAKLVAGAGECRLYEPLAKHTTLKVGGPADTWVQVTKESALAELIYYTKTRTIPLYLIGRGTNLLIKDRGIRGICCHLSGGDFEQIKFEEDQVYCGAGVRLKNLVCEAKKHGLGGLEFMEGIPGNLGGALRMNAGAMKRWTFDVVESIRVMDKEGKVEEIPVKDIDVYYRSVPVLAEKIALGATLKLVRRKREEINAIIKEYSAKRWDSQPPKPSAGCSFKNPGEMPAGKLIEELGLKGKKIGGATISTVHGNFIVNDRGATAEDVIALIAFVKEEARRKRNIALETEVIVLGE